MTNTKARKSAVNVGVDVGKDSVWAAVASAGDAVADWARLPVQSFAFSEEGIAAIVQWVANFEAIAGVCIESTGRLGWRFMAQLDGALGPVSMANPARTRAFGDSMGLRDKSDRVDACVLALYGVAMQPPVTRMRSAVLRELRECNRLFSVLSIDRQSYKKRLADGPLSATVRHELRRTIALLERRMKQVQARMDELVASDASLTADVGRITSIKGVGPRTAFVLLAEFGDLRDYSRNELASLAGLYPRQYESGRSVYKRPRMARRGGGPVRKALYLCAMSARKHNPQMRQLYERHVQNGKSPMAALGILMRKLLLLARSLLIHQTKYDPKYA